ncbi:MAG: acetyl/propionyl/methylcrotonyl-CoA carboxylase subunit alpha [Gammaproteobacteria bacterium]|nr:acetyl/propionyl/methylcrotonyl-CoA carboxylase subunit alpha [Gammaproteobacteria bacterium]
MTQAPTRILVANRGEIACRVVRTARRMGLETVAVYSDADAGALHVQLADQACHIGPAPARESYLDMEAVLEAAARCGADAVHPGYGFLAENADFAEACARAGLVFIGPGADRLRAMGTKSTALDIMARAGVPVLPGYRGEDQRDAALGAAADALGYPLLVKPVAGGGGKGMRVVESAKALRAALEASRREAAASFGDDRLLLERFLRKPRHVELQIFADRHGNAVHLFERDCSIQRRHQKILEEAPAPGLDETTRTRMGEVAVRAARSIDYLGAGTVEFLLDTQGDTNDGRGFFFMEMNTRLQVEHPVTEMVLGLDLVEWQIRVARGEPLPLAQTQVKARGHAIEARLYAEDPERGFLPAAGRLRRFSMPATDGAVRVDTGVREGDEVGIHYDPMIAKLVVHGEHRADAVQRLRAALDAFRIVGLPTNLPLLKRVAANAAYAAGRVHTEFLDEHAEARTGAPEKLDEHVVVMASLFVFLSEAAASRARGRGSTDPGSPWHTLAAWRLNAPAERVVALHDGDTELRVRVREDGDALRISLPAREVRARAGIADDGDLVADVDGRRLRATVVRDGTALDIFVGGLHRRLTCEDADLARTREEVLPGQLAAPMPGRVIAVLVAAGDRVARGEPLLVMEAMKMEHTIVAPADGTVSKVAFAKGDLVAEGAELVVIDAENGGC